ncbi:hypothetical protein D3C76_1177450 [compost metagenome]
MLVLAQVLAFVGGDAGRELLLQVLLPKILLKHFVHQTVAFLQCQHRIVGLIDHGIGDAGHGAVQHVFRLPGQAEALCQSGLIGQIDFNIIRVAFATGHVGPGNLVHLLQP